MLYHLFEYFERANIDFAGSGLMKYISFRSFGASIVAILISLIIGRKLIVWLKKKQIGETIRDLGLEGQLQKKGTPTMGGIIIIISILVPVLLFCDLTNINILILILTTVWFGTIGFLDDYIKVFKNKKEGLNGWYKIASQVLLGLIVGLIMCFSNEAGFREQKKAAPVAKSTYEVTAADNAFPAGTMIVDTDLLENSTKTTLPFVKNNEFDYGWLSPFGGGFGEYFKWFIYICFIILVITACSNGCNVTDGLDGLATGVTAIVGATLGIFAYLSGNVIYSEYLNIMYIPSSAEITVFFSAMVGALLGFMWYNSYPAQVFMGDTGSLTLGGIIGVCAILVRKELLLPLLCGIFFLESLSVVIQRFYFKYTKKKSGTGVRVFKMTPLHHHFQKENPDALIQWPGKVYPEQKVVARFIIISIILAVLTVVTLKIR